MKQTRYFTLLLLLLMVVTVARAVPARPGTKQTFTLNGGTRLSAVLTGDEYLHYWLTDDGLKLDDDGSVISPQAFSWLRQKAAARRMHNGERRTRRLKKAQTTSGRTLPVRTYEGRKRGLIILVEFSDLQFREGHDLDFYYRMANEVAFSTQDGFHASVHDYFMDQSRGRFDLTFDVLGPIKMPQSYTYYGQNGGKYNFDLHPGEMLISACQAVDDAVDFHHYDWDADGEVDQVMIIYAGRGENNGGGSQTIWPHEWTLDEAEGHTIMLDGLTINTYACSCEMKTNLQVDGIGTTCHEFSHCLGLPDFYDTDYGGHYGMDRWSVMAKGSYNDQAFTPAGFTSLERMCCGWLEPVVLQGDMEIDNMKGLTEGGEACIVSNDAWPDEFYLLENRQPVSWDAYLPGSGLLVIHVDYDEMAWQWNLVNTIGNFESEPGYGPGAVNDHQRCTIFHADNNNGSSATATYPQPESNELTPTSIPAAALFHPNSEGRYTMNASVTAITQNADGTVSFRFSGPEPTAITQPPSLITHHPSPITHHPSPITLTGRPAGRNPHGIIIINGKKTMIK